jgi:hypothetical protein
MRYIGRIITNGKIEDVSEFIEVTKDTQTISGREAKIPTLIVGYKRAQEIFGDVKILNKKIGKNLYWTFSKRERRVDYEEDLKNFQNIVSEFVSKFCDYEYIDVMTIDDDRRKEFNETISDGHTKVAYVTSTMYYIYHPVKNKTYGISKEVLKAIGSGEERMLKWLKNSSITVVSESEFSDLKIGKSKFVQPLLYYLATF